MQLIFDRRVNRRTPSRYRTRIITDGVTPSLHVDYKHSRIKQYHKEGRALRTETGRVDDWRGGGRRMGVAVPGGFRPLPVPHSPPWLRFQSPLIEPDVRFSRIRLSDEIMPSPTEGSSCVLQGG